MNNIGLGTAAIGRPLYINIKEEANDQEFSLLKFKQKGLQVLEDSYHKGVRYFDTSPGYGLAETLVLDWVGSKNDPTIEVSTKWGYTYVANFDPKAKQHEIKEHSINKLNEQWEYSKKLLPYLKVYQIHSATFDSGVLNNKDVLSRLHEIKKRYNIIIGLTTTGADQIAVLEKGLSIEIEHEALFQSFQCTFNILDQSVLKYAKELEKRSGPFIIKEALANGRLIPNDTYSQYNQLYTYMMHLAEKYTVGVDAIALRYCIEMFPTAIVLSGVNNKAHLNSNLKSNHFSLSDSEIKRLQDYGVSASDYWLERKELQWN